MQTGSSAVNMGKTSHPNYDAGFHTSDPSQVSHLADTRMN